MERRTNRWSKKLDWSADYGRFTIGSQEVGYLVRSMYALISRSIEGYSESRLNNRDPYAPFHLMLEVLKKEKKALEKIKDKLLDRIIEEKQRVEWCKGNWDKECTTFGRKIKEQEDDIRELKRQRHS
ncbi:hypothetical protein ACH5RR_000810 [Cinchona calisaya]|uniref:Uncharacterized protein n=1 Tax=Cinchona calisaya TaxID=153742 RepID=A0ABD3B1U0_9GENT